MCEPTKSHIVTLPRWKERQSMTERTTPDPGVLCNDVMLTADSRGPTSMTVQHDHSQVTANIFIQGADSPYPTYMMCFGRISGEPEEDTAARWDRLAEQMYRMGLEPPEDEPWYTVVDDGVVWDHYTLRPIQEDAQVYERPLHV